MVRVGLDNVLYLMKNPTEIEIQGYVCGCALVNYYHFVTTLCYN